MCRHRSPVRRRPRLLLLDGHSLAYRAFFALPVENFSTTTGQPTNAVYGFTSMLINVQRDERPTHIGVAFDKSRQTFRLEQYAEYKAKRNKTPDEFKSQLPLIKEVLDALHIRHLEVDGYEADDIIATLTTQALDQGFEVLLLTGDRDCIQLVTEHSTVLYPFRGVSDLARMTPEAVEAKYGVPPHRYPEIAALVGEDSDNLPGVPGVGPKTAAKWISTYDGLDNVITHADEINGKAGDSLPRAPRRRHPQPPAQRAGARRGARAHARPTWPSSRGTARRCTSSSTASSSGSCATGSSPTLDSEEEVEEVDFDLDTTRLGSGELAGWLEAHAAPGERVGLQVQGSWRAAAATSTPSRWPTGDESAAWLDVEQISPEDDAVLAGWLADPAYPKVLHDAKGPILALAARGWRLAGLDRDTALSAYLARPDQRSYDLADLTVRYLKRELKLEAGSAGDDGQLSFDSVGDDAAGDTAMLHAWTVLELASALDEELDEGGGTRLLADVELPLSACSPSSSGSASPSTYRKLEALEAALRRRGEEGGRRGVRRDRQGDQPRLAQAAAGGALRRAGHAEDQAHQDRLHHRRRRPAGPLRQDRAPVPAAPAPAPGRLPAAADGRGAAQDRRLRRPDPHHLQPADRRDRPAVVDRAEPSEHPGPHRGGPAHPRGVRRRTGLRDA